MQPLVPHLPGGEPRPVGFLRGGMDEVALPESETGPK